MDAVFKRILVTGAQGFVGRYLVSWCAQADPSVQILGIGRSPQIADTFTHRVQWGAEILRAPLPLALRHRGAHVKYVAADLGNRRVIARLLDDFQPEVVFHVASALHHDPPDALFQTNIMGTAALLEALAQSRCRVRLAV